MEEEYIYIYTVKYFEEDFANNYVTIRGMVAAKSAKDACDKIFANYPENLIEDLKIQITDLPAFAEFVCEEKDEKEEDKQIVYTKELEQLIAFAETGEY